MKERQRKRQTTRYQYGINPDVPTGTVGALAELLVAADLLGRGYAIFRAMSPSCYCDLIAVKGDEVRHIEVRFGNYNADGTLAYARRHRNPAGPEVEFAVYTYVDRQIHYIRQGTISVSDGSAQV